MLWQKDGKIYDNVVLHTIHKYINENGVQEEIPIQVFNPTEEDLINAGYEKYIEPDKDKLTEALQQKILEIEDYANSDAVNDLTYNGVHTWLTPEIRANYNVSLDAAELLGEEYISFAIGNQALSTTIKQARIILAKIQRYADITYMVTVKHKAAVSKLKSLEEINNYDITTGYPQKLEF